MDRRRFFGKQSLKESLSQKQARYSLEAVFEELDRLYEADATSEQKTDENKKQPKEEPAEEAAE